MSFSRPSIPASVGVSIVIPAYNYARFLPKAIDSLLRQDYASREILVVDDGSTDNTREVVARYGDKVRYIHQTNQGLPAARNAGIKAARFEFVGFLDADDEWLPGMLRQSMNTFESLPEEFALVACLAVYVDGESNPLPRKRLVPMENRILNCRDLLMKTQFSPSSVIARRRVLEECGGFDPALRSAEDRDMWIRMTVRYRALLHGDRWVLTRRHPNNMSKHADRMRSNTRRVLRQAYEKGYVSRSNVFLWLRVFSFNHFETAWMYRDEGRRGLAFKELVLSMLKWPFFSDPKCLNEPFLFRLRSLARFTHEAISPPEDCAGSSPQQKTAP